VLLRRHINPTALTAQVATVDNRNVQIGRKELAAFQPPLMQVNRPQPFHAHVPGQLPQQALIGFQQHSFGESKIHVMSF
jgi:hypothetical protein